MKKVLKFLSIPLAALIIAGCGGVEAKPPSERTPLSIEKHEVSGGLITLEGRIAYENTTPIQAAALQLREAAKILKKEGYSHFTINSKYASPLTTKFADMIAYCYPDSSGPHFKDYEHKSTGLETDKCRLREIVWKNGDSKGFRLIVWGQKIQKLDTATWSVEQVLNDPLIEEYIHEDAQIFPQNQIITFHKNEKLPVF